MRRNIRALGGSRPLQRRIGNSSMPGWIGQAPSLQNLRAPEGQLGF